MIDNRERVAEIEARVNAATPGEWNRDTHPQEPIIASRTEGETWYSIAPVCQVCYGDWTEGDAEFIAAAPADIRYLLARVRELEAALAKADAVIEGVYQQSNQPRVIEMTRNYLNERGENE